MSGSDSLTPPPSLLRLKTVEVLLRSLDEAESLVRRNESRLSEEDIVPADTTAIHNLREQLGVRHAALETAEEEMFTVNDTSNMTEEKNKKQIENLI